MQYAAHLYNMYLLKQQTQQQRDTMIDLDKASVTEIQFFNLTDDSSGEEVLAYSANIIINECLIVQVSGNEQEAEGASIPTSSEQYYNDEKLQDWAWENLDTDKVDDFLEREGIENNFHFLNEY